MESKTTNAGAALDGSLSALRQWIRPRARPSHPCEMCAAPLAPQHEHVLDMQTHQLACACQACAILFSGGNARYQRVPQRAELLTDFRLTDEGWDSLLIPIQLAFFYRSSATGRPVAMYPSPAGATESLLELTAWHDLAAENPVLDCLAPDVEALLVNRVGQAREAYRVSIDHCFALVGLIRMHWRGLSGGSEVWKRIGEYFDALKQNNQGHWHV